MLLSISGSVNRKQRSREKGCACCVRVKAKLISTAFLTSPPPPQQRISPPPTPNSYLSFPLAWSKSPPPPPPPFLAVGTTWIFEYFARAVHDVIVGVEPIRRSPLASKDRFMVRPSVPTPLERIPSGFDSLDDPSNFDCVVRMSANNHHAAGRVSRLERERWKHRTDTESCLAWNVKVRHFFTGTDSTSCLGTWLLLYEAKPRVSLSEMDACDATHTYIHMYSSRTSSLLASTIHSIQGFYF